MQYLFAPFQEWSYSIGSKPSDIHGALSFSLSDMDLSQLPLESDIFTLSGTIKEKGVEYLVKRSWLFGISVVNKKPRNRIRFKDMMDRLKRIGQSEVPSD